MGRRYLLGVLGTGVFASCSLNLEPQALPSNHPASIQAGEGPYSAPPNFFTGEIPVAPPKEGVPEDSPHHGHEGHGQAKAAPKPYPIKTCLVSEEELGKMGKPEVIVYNGQELRFCCSGCIQTFKKDPDKYLSKLPVAGMIPPKEKKVESKHEHEEKK